MKTTTKYNSDQSRVPVQQARLLLRDSLKKFDLTPADIEEIVDHLICSEILGKPTHGIFRLIGIIRRLLTDEYGTPNWEWISDARLHCAASGHLGYIVAAKTMQKCVERNLDIASGCVLGTISNASHGGRLGHYAAIGAEAGFIGFILTHTHPWVAAPNGKGAVLGSNGLAISMPFTRPPLIIDFTPNAISAGRVRIAAASDILLPGGVALSNDGQLTQDAKKVLEGGAILTAGEHKGYLVSLIINILAVMAGGAGIPQTPTGYGYLLGVISPDMLGFADYKGRVQELVNGILASGDVHSPGIKYSSLRERLMSEDTEIKLPRKLYEIVETIASLSDRYAVATLLANLQEW